MLREKAWRKKALWGKGGTKIQGESYRQQFVSPIKHTTREGNLWFPEVPFHQKPKAETVELWIWISQVPQMSSEKIECDIYS